MSPDINDPRITEAFYVAATNRKGWLAEAKESNDTSLCGLVYIKLDGKQCPAPIKVIRDIDTAVLGIRIPLKHKGTGKEHRFYSKMSPEMRGTIASQIIRLAKDAMELHQHTLIVCPGIF